MNWIKCSEQMPEDNIKVLVYNGNSINSAIYCTAYDKWKYEIYDCCGCDRIKPINWCEYPELPHE